MVSKCQVKCGSVQCIYISGDTVSPPTLSKSIGLYRSRVSKLMFIALKEIRPKYPGGKKTMMYAV